MWRRYSGEFFDVSSRLRCVGKPFPTSFKRDPSRQDPSSRRAAIAHLASLVAPRASPSHCATNTPPFGALLGSFDGPSHRLSDEPSPAQIRPLVIPESRDHRPPPPHQPHPPPHPLSPPSLDRFRPFRPRSVRIDELYKGIPPLWDDLRCVLH